MTMTNLTCCKTQELNYRCKVLYTIYIDGTEGYDFDHHFYVVVVKQCCTENAYAGHQQKYLYIN